VQGGLIGDILNQSVQDNILSNMTVISENHYKKFIFFVSVILLIFIHYLNKLIIKYKTNHQQKLLENDSMHQRVTVKNERKIIILLMSFIRKIFDLFNSIRSLPFYKKMMMLVLKKLEIVLIVLKTDEHIVIGESFESHEEPISFDLPSKKKVKTKRTRSKTPDIRKDNFDLFESNNSYSLPSINLLRANNQDDYSKKVSQSELEVRAEELKNVLLEYKVSGEIINIKPGPVVTLFEIEPSIGTRSSRVISLAEDIAMAMKAISARVAVIPGRNLIGIELPMEERSTVYLSEIIKSVEFENTNHKLAIALGKNIGGQPIVVDLSSMPHLLIAGTTGSGKSVGINTMILSLLYKYSPDRL
jgi:DNA segregation ATPase FtsK/SpoIIIE-like protein